MAPIPTFHPSVLRAAPADFEEVRERLDRAGPGALDTVECLAFALRRGARRAAFGWAERLLDEFGSLPELLGADRARLLQAATPAIARDVCVLHELQLRALRAPLRARPVLTDRAAVVDYLQAGLAAARGEQVRVLYLDKGRRLRGDELMGEGGVDPAPLYAREVMRRALELDAAGVILVRARPSGVTDPTPADLDAARRVIDAGRALRIAVHDQLLVAGRAVVSFRALGLL